MKKSEFKIGEVTIIKGDNEYKIIKGDNEQVVDGNLLYGISRFVLLDLIEEKEAEIATLRNLQYTFTELEIQRKRCEKENAKLQEKCEDLEQRYNGFIHDYRRVTNALLDRLDCVPDYDD
jgi:hypothetical protein